ncbi:unnamed protein product [Rotaria sp. Silwood2]|nr:unnamed protein product [Rotaria sp. Silwood2]
MMKTPGGLLSFNNFLSTSIDRQISLNFARQTTETSNLVGILFVMRIDSSILSTPYANVRDVSYLKGEEEILFSMNSIFRIGSIKYTDENNCVWQVELTLYSDNDPDLNILTEQIRKATYPEKKEWDRLDHLLIKLGQFNKAQEVYEILFEQAKTDSEKALMSHMLDWVKRNQGEYKDAITYYKKSIKIKEKILSPTDLSLAASYNNIGSVYNKMDGYSNSLSSHQKSLEIKQKILPSNHLDLGTSYNKIGSVYANMGDSPNALSFLEKALAIWQKSLPSTHPLLKTRMNNIYYVKKNM